MPMGISLLGAVFEIFRGCGVSDAIHSGHLSFKAISYAAAHRGTSTAFLFHCVTFYDSTRGNSKKL